MIQPNTQSVNPPHWNIVGQQNWQWVKKQTQTQPIKKKHKPQQPAIALKYNQQKTKQIWVPKTLLPVQGYYQGSTFIWVPKQTKCQHNVGQRQRQMQPNKAQPTKEICRSESTHIIDMDEARTSHSIQEGK